jgi:hypothetical protein
MLGQVISYGAAQFGKVSLLFFVLLAAAMPPRRRVAPLTALLADRPPVQRLKGSGPQRDTVRADDERVVRDSSVRGRAAPAIRPALGERRPRDSDAPSSTASPPEAQRTRLEDAGDAEPEPQLRARLKSRVLLNRNPKRPRALVCGHTHRYSATTLPFLRIFTES